MTQRAADQAALPGLADWLARLDFRQGRCLGRSNQGEVRRFSFCGQDLAIKTPKGRGPLRWLRLKTLKREHQAYLRLFGVPGFARCHGLFHERYLVLDFIEGEDFRHASLDNRDEFFTRLLESIQIMHARGVAHGDLKRKDNLRVDRDGRPVIIDLGTAVLGHQLAGPVRRRLFKFIRQTDLNAWVKLKYGGYSAVTAEDHQHLRRSALERLLGSMRLLRDRKRR